MFHLFFQSAPVDSLADTIELFDRPGFGEVEDPITQTQSGHMCFKATYWEAILYDSTVDVIVPCRSQVRVLGRRGLILLVVPM